MASVWKSPQLKTWWYLTEVNEKKTNKQKTLFFSLNPFGNNEEQLLPGASWQSQTDLFVVLATFFQKGSLINFKISMQCEVVFAQKLVEMSALTFVNS